MKKYKKILKIKEIAKIYTVKDYLFLATRMAQPKLFFDPDEYSDATLNARGGTRLVITKNQVWDNFFKSMGCQKVVLNHFWVTYIKIVDLPQGFVK